jgi:hypothetical protein
MNMRAVFYLARHVPQADIRTSNLPGLPTWNTNIAIDLEFVRKYASKSHCL